MSHAPNTSGSANAQLEPFDDPEPGSTWFISLAGVIVLVALVIAISAVAFRAEHKEFEVKVVDRSAGALPVIPAAPLDASAVRTLSREIDQRRDEGVLSAATYTKLSQGLQLNAWMRYPWEDSKGQTQQLIRIPVAEAMKIVAQEYAGKGGAKRVATAPEAVGTAPVSAPAPTAREGATP